VSDESGAFPTLDLPSLETQEELFPVGTYEVAAVGQSSGQELHFATYSVTCDSTTDVEIEPLPQLSLSVTVMGGGNGRIVSSPAGIDCSTGTCSAEYDLATEVTLTAQADMNSEFVGWSGACSGAGVCSVSLDQSRSVTAEFVPISDAFVVALTGNGRGSVRSNPSGISCSNDPGSTSIDCSETFRRGTALTLTAQPSEGSTFVGWSGGGCSGNAPSCVTTIAGAAQVSAEFRLRLETLSITKNGTGTGQVIASAGTLDCGSVCSAEYDFGTMLVLTAQPNPDSTFNGWSGACTGSDPVCTVTISQLTQVTATFNRIEPLTAPLITWTSLGDKRQGQVQGLGLNYYIAAQGAFPSPEDMNRTDQPLIGQIMLNAGNLAPSGWLPCDGSLVSIATYSPLFSVIGTTYGGDGRTHFRVPDLRARVAMGIGSLDPDATPPTGLGESLVPVVSSTARAEVATGQV
jgi:microcystin-dependent protein